VHKEESLDHQRLSARTQGIEFKTRVEEKEEKKKEGRSESEDFRRRRFLCFVS
jgi:hypothetical protein